MRWFYKCPSCGGEYAIEPNRYLCDVCASKQRPGRPLEGVLECHWDGFTICGPGDIPMPIPRDRFPHFPVGDTSLWNVGRLRDATGFKKLWVKDDTRNPSGSFKDRASVLVAAFARQHGIAEVSLASTGNAASSMACVGAATGLRVTVFLPKSAPQAKRIQVLQYGAELREVDGTYDDAFAFSLEYCAKAGVLSRNTAHNPLTIEGKKTVAFELFYQLNRLDEREPDHIFIPTGDGVILSGVYRGFEDLLKLGRIGTMPTLWACQAEGSCAIARAFESGGFGDPVPSSTLADSIAVDVPSAGIYAIGKLKQHNGHTVIVSDDQILASQYELASHSGIFAEPSSACAYAGFLKAKANIDPSSSVVVLATGSGLKDVGNATVLFQQSRGYAEGATR